MELTGAIVVQLPGALTASSVRDLRAALQKAAARPDGAVMVLVGSDQETFCDGMDISAALEDGAPEGALEDFAACLDVLRSGRAATVSVVRGRASGGGVGLAAACDGVLAVRGATFGLPELLFGLTPAIILPCLLERMRPQKVRWLALSTERLDADDACHAGLVDRVCAPGAESGVLRSWIRQLKRLDPDAARHWKRSSAGSESGSRDGVHETLTRLRQPQVRERIRAFIETGDLPWMENER